MSSVLITHEKTQNPNIKIAKLPDLTSKQNGKRRIRN